MTEVPEDIKIRYTLKQGMEDALGNESVRIFPVSRWLIYLILTPAFIALAFLSALFFSIFLPLFVFGGITVGFWVWWQHRKRVKSSPAQSLEGEYFVIQETHIVETLNVRKEER